METGLTLYKSVAVAEGRRSAANVPAVVESLNGVEKSVFTASTGKMVSEYTDAQCLRQFLD